MAEDYQNVVLASYKKKRDKGKLSIILSNPTTAKLKQATLNTYDTRYTASDSDVFATFFNIAGVETDFRKLIDKADAEDFKPLQNFIKEKVSSTNDKNSELLAWLIDFKARPSTTYYRMVANGTYKEDEEEDDDKTNTDKDKGSTNGGETSPPQGKNTAMSKKNILAACIIFLIIGRIIFYVWDQKTNQIRMPLAEEKCMYWTGNHYEPIKCDERVGYLPIIPLNMEQLKKQQKISFMYPISKTALKRAWYAKIEGSPQLFTHSGINPLDTTRRLNRITDYMINKYDLDKRLIPKYINWAYSIFLFTLIIWFITLYFKKEALNLAKPEIR